MMFGITEHEMVGKRMRLVGALGGFGLRIDSVGLAADAAFWSSWVTTSEMVPDVAARAGLGQGHQHARLVQAGLLVDEHGRVEFSKENAKDYSEGPWQ